MQQGLLYLFCSVISGVISGVVTVRLITPDNQVGINDQSRPKGVTSEVIGGIALQAELPRNVDLQEGVIRQKGQF